MGQNMTRLSSIQTGIIDPKPSNEINFNIGARIYPREVPRLRINAAALGDGQFDFAFSLSYNFTPLGRDVSDARRQALPCPPPGAALRQYYAYTSRRIV